MIKKTQIKTIKKHPNLFMPPANNAELNKLSTDNSRSSKKALRAISSANPGKRRPNMNRPIGTLSNKNIGQRDPQTLEETFFGGNSLTYYNNNTAAINTLKKSRL